MLTLSCSEVGKAGEYRVASELLLRGIQLAHDIALYVKAETHYRYWGRIPYYGGDPHKRLGL
jgi:hypothetical protein